MAAGGRQWTRKLEWNSAYLLRIAVSCRRIGCGPVADRIPAALPDGGRRRGVRWPANPASGNRLPLRIRWRRATRPDVLLRDVVVAAAAAAVVVAAVVVDAVVVGGGGWVPVVLLRRNWRWIQGPDPFRLASASGRPKSCTHLICIFNQVDIISRFMAIFFRIIKCQSQIGKISEISQISQIDNFGHFHKIGEIGGIGEI